MNPSQYQVGEGSSAGYEEDRSSRGGTLDSGGLQDGVGDQPESSGSNEDTKLTEEASVGPHFYIPPQKRDCKGDQEARSKAGCYEWPINFKPRSEPSEQPLSDVPCTCPRIKLLGCNLDSSLLYLSPRARVKCKDLCRPKCGNRHAIVIRPGDGSNYCHFKQNPELAEECGYVPPYDFKSDGRNLPKEECCEPAYRIERNHCNYPFKDHVESNAIEAARGIPKVPIPKVAITHHGDKTEWCKSGLARNYIFGKNYGRMPRYMCGVKTRLAKEDYRLRCILTNQGDVCSYQAHNQMNQIGLLGMQRTKHPMVYGTKLWLEPKNEHTKLRKVIPHPCFRPSY